MDFVAVRTILFPIDRDVRVMTQQSRAKDHAENSESRGNRDIIHRGIPEFAVAEFTDSTDGILWNRIESGERSISGTRILGSEIVEYFFSLSSPFFDYERKNAFRYLRFFFISQRLL